MTKRTVTFALNGDAVTPSMPLFGGVKGEHNATQLVITLGGEPLADGEIVRLQFTTGDGAVLSSDMVDVADACVTFPIPQLLTTAGQLCVRVVRSVIDAHGSETQTYRSPEMVLYFEEAGVENGTPFWTGVSEMLARTVAAKDAAVTAEDASLIHAQAAMGAASEAKYARDDANEAMEKASGYAEIALAKADTAEQAANAALTAGRTAEAAANTAKAQASLVAEQASAVEKNYTTAVNAATTAQRKATEAQNHADTAEQAAQEAKEAADRAQAGGTYVLTEADKQEIAAICKSLINDGNGVAY